MKKEVIYKILNFLYEKEGKAHKDRGTLIW